MKHYIFYIVTLLLLGGCATADRDSSRAEGVGPDMRYNGSDCILVRTIRDYTPLDDQHLLIRGTGNRAYYVALLRPTFEMRGSFSLRFDSRDDQLCPFGGDAIVFGSLGRERVNIRSISRVTAEQEEQLLIRYGKREPDESETPVPPGNVKGADVEELG